jgi:hypothetical protein
MRFTIEIGQQERHQVDFLWSKWFGVAKIWVDGILKQKSQPLALEELAQLASLRGVSGQARFLRETLSGKAAPQMIRGWSIEVGEREKHSVLIEKERPAVLAAFRSHIYRVFIDGHFSVEHVG